MQNQLGKGRLTDLFRQAATILKLYLKSWLTTLFVSRT